ncbi:MAG: ATP synthase F1 subunit delta [Lachnospiraceae bacterium]|nr:ATP synthase F1 subunit delta [Lachnospiraceae bacterium]
MAKSVAGVYSEALFELANEQNALRDYMEELAMLQGLLKEQPEFGKLLSHPRISREEKLEVVEQTFTGQLVPELLGFLRLLVEKDRTASLEDILEGFLDKAREALKIGRVFVRSAVAMSDGQKKALEDKLLESTSFETLEMDYSVDKALIGGMVISIGDRVVDNSLRTKLYSLERELLWKARMDYLRTA